jgi:phage tail sheath protein FI
MKNTLDFIEQSCELELQAFVFEPNTSNTWIKVKANITRFLMELWKDGVLQGATAEDSFSISCGVGTTMTSVDILEGLMRISIRVALVNPAEFDVITIEQEMHNS